MRCRGGATCNDWCLLTSIIFCKINEQSLFCTVHIWSWQCCDRELPSVASYAGSAHAMFRLLVLNTINLKAVILKSSSSQKHFEQFHRTSLFDHTNWEKWTLELTLALILLNTFGQPHCWPEQHRDGQPRTNPIEARNIPAWSVWFWHDARVISDSYSEAQRACPS